ncbi:hypothetical protein PC128_g2013 [Phytophthora cactorum]|nr:hypothetical protein PC128_g2013 [Phytophthora cactorum]
MSMLEYIQRARHLISCITTHPVDMATQVHVFTSGMNAGYQRLFLTRKTPSTLEEAFAIALREDYSVTASQAFDASRVRVPEPEPEPMEIDAIQQFDGRRGATPSLVLGRLERESQICLHGRHDREAGSVGNEFAERPFLRLPRQLGEQEARTRELGRQLPSLNCDAHFTEPPVQVKATVAFAAVARDIELNDVGLVRGRCGSRHPPTKVGDFTRHELLGGQELLSFRTGSEKRLDDGFTGRRGEAV